VYQFACLFEVETTLFTPSSNFWGNDAGSSEVLNSESFNFSGCELSGRPVSGVFEHTFDHLCRPHCHKLSALDKAWNGQFERENLPLRWIQLTLVFIQLFNP